MTDNHAYNTPAEGATDWHVPLNDNFERLDADVEVRDRETARGGYAAKAGAKYFATDTGAVFIGDGSSWNRLAHTGDSPSFTAASVDQAPSSPTDVARKTELDAKADQSALSAKADADHDHSGDALAPSTVTADRIEADTVVTNDAGTTVWDAYEQSIPSGSPTTVEFETVETDQRSQWNASNHEISVSEPGNYLVSAGIFWRDTPSDGTNHWFTVKRNGNVGVAQAFSPDAGGEQLQTTRPVLGVNAGDTFHLEVEQYEGSSLRIGGNRISTYLSVVQL
jgi:hypothetical protein